MVSKKRRSIAITLDSVSSKRRLKSHPEGSFTNLNDHCVLAIFEHLNQMDLCHVQNVCRRFVPLTEIAFKSALKKNPHWTRFKMDESISDTRRVIYKFGHIYETVSFWCKVDAAMVQRLTNVTTLSLVRNNIDWEMIKVVRASEHLRTFGVVDCKFIDNNGDSISKGLDKRNSILQRLIFYDQLPPISMFSEFLEHNQQILCMGLAGDFSEDYIPYILQHAQQLNELNFFTKNNSLSTKTFDMISNLKNLKKLMVVDFEIMTADGLVEGIEQKAPNLIHLELKNIIFKTSTLKTISRMKNLQHMTLSGIFGCVKAEIVLMVASLLYLKTLSLTFQNCASPRCQSRYVKFNTLKEILEAGKQLNLIKLLGVREVTIDEKGYEQLLDVLQKDNRNERLLIVIEGCRATTSFNVPLYVQSANVKCMRIDYEVDQYCLCKLS